MIGQIFMMTITLTLRHLAKVYLTLYIRDCLELPLITCREVCRMITLDILHLTSFIVNLIIIRLNVNIVKPLFILPITLVLYITEITVTNLTIKLTDVNNLVFIDRKGTESVVIKLYVSNAFEQFPACTHMVLYVILYTISQSLLKQAPSLSPVVYSVDYFGLNLAFNDFL